MIPITDEQKESKEFEYDNDKVFMVRDNCHCIGKQRGASHSLCCVR